MSSKKAKSVVDTIYAWVSEDQDEHERILMVKVGGREFPGVMRTLEAAKELEAFMTKIKKDTGQKVTLKKFSSPKTVRVL